MLFVVQFRDEPGMLHIRKQKMAAHLEFLKKHQGVVRVAGSLRREEDDSAVGGMWIVDAATFEEVKQLYRDDPFWIAGLRQSVEVHRRAKAFPDQERAV